MDLVIECSVGLVIYFAVSICMYVSWHSGSGNVIHSSENRLIYYLSCAAIRVYQQIKSVAMVYSLQQLQVGLVYSFEPSMLQGCHSISF